MSILSTGSRGMPRWSYDRPGKRITRRHNEFVAAASKLPTDKRETVKTAVKARADGSTVHVHYREHMPHEKRFHDVQAGDHYEMVPEGDPKPAFVVRGTGQRYIPIPERDDSDLPAKWFTAE